MSLPLKDYRFGVPEWVDVWLDAEATAFGRDKYAVAREVLAELARKKSHAYKVATKRLHANGMQPEFPGFDAEDAGSERSGSR